MGTDGKPVPIGTLVEFSLVYEFGTLSDNKALDY